MMDSIVSYVSIFILLKLLTPGILVACQDENQAKVVFRNELNTPIDLFWEGPTERILQASLGEHGGEFKINTYPGHRFSYDYGDHRHFEDIPDLIDYYRVLLAGSTEINVKCTTTALGGKDSDRELVIRVIPWWSPRGASQFLEMVRKGYYNGVALNRVVPGFLTQFGIGPNYDARTHVRKFPIFDDPPHESPIHFSPGMVSFAGSGPNSRTTEVFVVMPGVSQGQLDYFGTNSWETPFGVVDNIDTSVVIDWFAYGDMPPWGEGPDPSLIYEENGYKYLKQKFPDMDYIESCYVVDIKPMVEGEL